MDVPNSDLSALGLVPDASMPATSTSAPATPAAATPPAPVPTTTLGTPAPKAKAPAPTLQFPPLVTDLSKFIAGLPKGKKYTEEPLEVQVIEGSNGNALWFPIITLIIVFFLCRLLTDKWLAEYDNNIGLTVSLMIPWGLAFLLYEGLQTSVGAQSARAFFDKFASESKRRIIYAFRTGFHFKPYWWAKAYENDIDFRREEVVAASLTDKNATIFNTADPFEVIAEWECLVRFREDGLCQSLRHRPEVILDRTKTYIEARVEQLGGLNVFESLNAYPGEVSTWVSLVFGKEDELSDFEQEYGIQVRKLKLKSLRLTDASAKKLIETKPLAAIVKQVTEDLTSSGVSPDKASDVATLVAGLAQKNILEYGGLPQGAKFIALGTDIGSTVRSIKGGGK